MTHRRRSMMLGGIVAAVVIAALLSALLRKTVFAPSGKRQPAAGTTAAPRAAKPVGPTLLVLPRPRSGPHGGGAGLGAGGTSAPEYVPGQILVKFEEGTRPEAADAALDRAEVEADTSVQRIGVAVVDAVPGESAEAIASLKASPAVEYVERDVAVTAFDTIPNDSLWPDQWGPAEIKAPRAWDIETGSSGISVAVLDTGVNRGHPDLSKALVAGYDFVNNDADPADDNGHGTAAAGVIAARTNNRTGQAGICWSCSVMPVKVLGAKGTGATSDVAAGVIWAADHGAKVINMSLGAAGTTQTLTDAVEYAAKKGVVLVAAAGNNGASSPTYPAAYPGVISVAATTPSGTLYSWSNYGRWVQVAAPGCNAAPGLSGGYVNFCGTSSAAPIVSGIAGLALSMKPKGTKIEIEQAIRRSALAVSTDVQYGRVDAASALAALGGTAPSSPRPSATPPRPAPAASSDTPKAGEAVVRGRLTRSVRQQRFSRVLPTGRLIVMLTFAGRGRLTLTALDARGRSVGRVAGRSSLRLAGTLPAGRYSFVVSGKNGSGRFALRFTPG